MSFENLSRNQKVRATLHRDVRVLCSETCHFLGLEITKPAMEIISELVYRKICMYGSDLEAFVKHAKRSTINAEDVKLLVRRNPSLIGRWHNDIYKNSNVIVILNLTEAIHHSYRCDLGGRSADCVLDQWGSHQHNLDQNTKAHLNALVPTPSSAVKEKRRKTVVPVNKQSEITAKSTEEPEKENNTIAEIPSAKPEDFDDAMAVDNTIDLTFD